MRNLSPITALLLLQLASASVSGTAGGAPLDATQVAATLQRAADWQLANPNRTELREWVIAPLYDGLIDVSETTGDPKYLAAVVRMGRQSGWMPGPSAYHADDHAVGHAWLDVYLMDPSKKERLKPFQERLDAILARPVTERLLYAAKPRTGGVHATDRWTWCDALYMAPPTWARLAKATSDPRYLAFLDAEYKATYDTLYDTAENLFYRDERFIGQKTPNGRKVFWSRGNGWVFAGLPMLLEALPESHGKRPFYLDLFKRMAPAVLAAQQPDGLWYPSLLDPKQVEVGETSGSAFFVYGLAWGVRHRLLERDRCWPAVERGWAALVPRLRPDGLVGFVQRIGDAPDKLREDSTQLYGTGGVLMAGSEILRAIGAAKPVDAAGLLAVAEKLLADDQTPRAYARLVPERKDDLAWENDKVAFRCYGPALRAGDEASGIDLWAKKVPRPVIDRWYADDLAGRRSYHEDHGEGYDGYKVGDSPGCGGLVIWQDDKPVPADVYDQAAIRFTKPDVVEIETTYTYPAIQGKVYHETRTLTLRLGQHLNEITSRFTLDAGQRRPAAGLDVAVGLMAQTPAAKFTCRPESGVMAVWDVLMPGKEPLGLGALVPPGARMVRLAHTTTEPKADQVFAVVRTDDQGRVRYRAGFGWQGDGATPSQQAWLDSLDNARQAGGN